MAPTDAGKQEGIAALGVFERFSLDKQTFN
jgi:hypothetical protein